MHVLETTSHLIVTRIIIIYSLLFYLWVIILMINPFLNFFYFRILAPFFIKACGVDGNPFIIFGAKFLF